MAKSSFATDSQIFAELDSIVGTTIAKTHKREVVLRFLQFLQSKGWKMEMIAEMPVGPKQHSIPELVWKFQPSAITSDRAPERR